MAHKVKKGQKASMLVPKPTCLLCEFFKNPIGIDVVKPRFSWILSHPERGRTQSAYQILVANSQERLLKNGGDIWDSGKVDSRKSVNIDYDGVSLESMRTYYWKVRWWDDKGRSSPFSDIASFEIGLLCHKDWKAIWVEGGVLLRKSFTIDQKALRARVYVCGLGYYDLRINGKKVSDHQLDPSATDYDKVVLYSTFDITEHLRLGENVVAVMLGNGWYARKLPPEVIQNLPEYFKFYEGASPKLILQMNLEFSGGVVKLIVTDESWKVSEGPIVENDIYNGEIYDARLEKEGWDNFGYDDSAWANVKIAKPPAGRLVSQATFPPIKAMKTILPTALNNPKPSVFIYDFGQNFTGWVKLTVRGPRGTEVKMKFAELVYPDGKINTATNRSAKCTDTYVLKGEGVEVYEPRFTYHGFRYVEVTGFPGTPNLDTIKGIVVHSAVEPVGGFQCSNQLVNKIHQNVLWGQLSNIMSIPTDCPQRDERMGWMGDAQLSAEEAMYNFDMVGFYKKWVRDIKEAQRDDGSIPDVVPPYWMLYPADPAWGTACITIPWLIYNHYGDQRILEENYDLVKGWVDFLGIKYKDNSLYSKYGDWCPPAQVKSLETSGELVSMWYYYHDTILLSKISQIVGRKAEAKMYAELGEKIKEDFNKKFLKGDHYTFNEQTYTSGSQTSNLLPLYLDMVPEDKKDAVLQKLVKDIEIIRDSHVGTGIVGTRYLLDTLTKHGYANLAYKIVTQTTYPGWGYMIKKGATTLWERWEFLSSSGMNSHNHIMLGSVDAWFYKILAGINVDQEASGFENIIIKPHVVGDLNHVAASINTIRGLVSSSWKKEVRGLALNVTVPVNSIAKVSVPIMSLENPVVKEGGKIVWRNDAFVRKVPGIVTAKQEEQYITFNTGSGQYAFEITEA